MPVFLTPHGRAGAGRLPQSGREPAVVEARERKYTRVAECPRIKSTVETKQSSVRL